MRGNWEDAIDAVSLTLEDGTILCPDGRNADENAAIDNKDSTKSSDDNKLAVFHSMEKLCFKEISILVDPESLMLRVFARDKKATIPFRLLELIKRNGISLNKQGLIFMEIINGNFSSEERGTNRALSRLSKSLRKAFATEDHPFLKNIPQFKLSIPKDKEAKWLAARRTYSYDDNRAYTSNDSSYNSLREHDSDYDSDNPAYSSDKNY